MSYLSHRYQKQDTLSAFCQARQIHSAPALWCTVVAAEIFLATSSPKPRRVFFVLQEGSGSVWCCEAFATRLQHITYARNESTRLPPSRARRVRQVLSFVLFPVLTSVTGYNVSSCAEIAARTSVENQALANSLAASAELPLRYSLPRHGALTRALSNSCYTVHHPLTPATNPSTTSPHPPLPLRPPHPAPSFPLASLPLPHPHLPPAHRPPPPPPPRQ